MRRWRHLNGVHEANQLCVQVFVSDSRISVYIDVDTWVLVMMKVRGEDEGTYECHVNSDPPQKLAIHLIVQGAVFDTFIINYLIINYFIINYSITNYSITNYSIINYFVIKYFILFSVVPIMKVMDGFGRHLRDQYYKAGSSLEVVCEVSF